MQNRVKRTRARAKWPGRLVSRSLWAGLFKVAVTGVVLEEGRLSYVSDSVADGGGGWVTELLAGTKEPPTHPGETS